MKRLMLGFALAVLPYVAQADSFPISGTLTLPDKTITYDLTFSSQLVSFAVGGTSILDSLIGTILFYDKSGSLFSTWNTGDLYNFGIGESMTLLEFSTWKPCKGDPVYDCWPPNPKDLVAKYDFVATGLNQLEIDYTKGTKDAVTLWTLGDDPPPFAHSLLHVNESNVGQVPVPEPSVLVLLALGLVLLCFGRSTR